MKIGIDYRLANCSYRGMARYCREIVKELVNLDAVNQYILIVDTDLNDQAPVSSNVKYVKIPIGNFIIGEQISIPKVLRKESCDVFWSPYNTFPVFMPKRTRLIVTVHDMIFFYPLSDRISFTQRVGALYRRFILRFFHKKASAFFTVSQFSKVEMLRYLDIRVPIRITYNCVNNLAGFLAEREKKEYQSGDYFFTVSGDAPSKNLQMLMRIFEKYYPQQQLWVAGVPEKSALRIHSPSNVHFVQPGIPDAEFITYYLECKCFLFCSRFEGFGIPIIEAAICGKPIIASGVTSIPEILGEKGWLIEPSEDGIRKAIGDFLQGRYMDSDYTSIIHKFNDWNKQAQIVNRLCLEICDA